MSVCECDVFFLVGLVVLKMSEPKGRSVVLTAAVITDLVRYQSFI